MGLFDWVMHGLGFETTEKKKNKKSKNNLDDKYICPSVIDIILVVI